MFNGDPSPPLPTLSTEMIQKYLEENKELIMATLEGQNQGKFAEVSQCLAKLQHNLTYLAKLADAAPQPQAQMHSQGQGMQHPHVAMPQQQQDLSTLNLPFDMNDAQQQHHMAMSQQLPDLPTSKLPFQMNEQPHKVPAFFQQQQQPIPGPMGNFGGVNSGLYQAQTRLNNLSDMPETNQFGPDVSPVWSLGKSPSGPTGGNTRS